MNKHKIIFISIVLAFVFFFGFLATYSHDKEMKDVIKTSDEIPLDTSTTSDLNYPVKNIPPVNFAKFGDILILTLSSQSTFSDGLNVSLAEINDSRCPTDVQCIWAGELSAVLELSNGDINNITKIQLGTVNNKSTTLGAYTFILDSATIQSANIIVLKK